MDISLSITAHNLAELSEKMLKTAAGVENIQVLIKRFSENLRIIRRALKGPTNVGTKQSLLTAMGKIMSYRATLKARLHRGDGTRRRRHPLIEWKDLEAAFQGRMRTGLVINLGHKDPISFLEDCAQISMIRLKNALKKEPFLKVNAVFCGKFIKVSTAGDEEIEEDKYLNSKTPSIISADTNLTLWFAENIMLPILAELEEFQERDSGWALKEVINLTLSINKHTPLRAASFIDLPTQIKNKKACVNVQNDDEFCFAWAVTSALYPKKENPNRTSSYPHYSTVLNLEGIIFPMQREQIPKFEKQNNISINVYVLKRLKSRRHPYEVTPSYLSTDKTDRHINLLLIADHYKLDDEEDVQEGDYEPIRYHYLWIKNLSRLISNQLSKHHGKKHVCDRCLHYFSTEALLTAHELRCREINKCKIKLIPDGKVYFKNYGYKEKAPFTIYADFESLLIPCNEQCGASSRKYQKHDPYSVAYYFKCSYDDSLSYFRSYRGPNAPDWFCRELSQIAENVCTVHLCPIPMNELSEEEEIKFHDPTAICHICEKVIQEPLQIKVRDHCHLTGRYRGPAHAECNLNYQDTRIISVIFHNFSGYDAHFILSEIVRQKWGGKLSVIPHNTENFIGMIKSTNVMDPDNSIRFKFCDSFRFMASSLDRLANDLHEKPILRSQFKTLSDERFELLTRKGVFPYDYMNSWERLEERSLPTREEFHCQLYNKELSQEEYEHALRIWREMNINTLGEYADLYLKTDVLLLADVFESFRDQSLKNHHLDPAHYFSAPGLSWDAMLKYTKVELDMIQDIDILMFLEKGIRGGLTQCVKRYARANNKYMENYDPSQPPSYLMYYDLNAMYSWAMCQTLPSGDLKWMEPQPDGEYFLNVSASSSIGYILEVDLEYPESIHDLQSDLPMAPELALPPGGKSKKMLATLLPKQNYIIHYTNLQQCIKNGMVLTRIHRVLQFKQSKWLKKYIDLNTRLRQAATNDFAKNYFKLTNNAVFGKTMENVRNRRIIKVLKRWEGRYGVENAISAPNFYRSRILDEDLVLVEMLKTAVVFNKPIYVGFCILDISKTLIYDFHYSYMKVKYGEKCEVLYGDTDSLFYSINTDDVYEDIKEDLANFDTSDYPADNRYDIPRANKKVPGLMKDENCGRIMSEFIGLRAKMYAYIVPENDNECVKKAKGVKSYVVRNEITFADYKKSLMERVEFTHTQNSIRSFNHQVFTVTQKKISLSPHDNKRCLLNNSHNTLPWGHYSLREANDI